MRSKVKDNSKTTAKSDKKTENAVEYQDRKVLRHRFDFEGAPVYVWEYLPVDDNEDEATNTKKDTETSTTPTVIMIHGFRGTHHGLDDIIAEVPDFHVYNFDLPGFGKSAPFAGTIASVEDAAGRKKGTKKVSLEGRTHNADNYADMVAAFIRDKGLKEPVLFGHSFGSMIAARIARDHPKLIGKLVLAAPIVTPSIKTFNGKFAEVQMRVGRILPGDVSEKFLGAPVFTKIAHSAMTKTPDRALWNNILDQHLAHFSDFYNTRVLNEAYISSSRDEIISFASKITVPTLIIAGRLDSLATVENSEKLLEAMPNAWLAIIEETGHIMHHETPGAITELVREFATTRRL